MFLVVVNQKSLCDHIIFTVNTQQGTDSMANLVLQRQGEFWEVYDADRGVTVFSATNQSVAQAFINNNNDSIASRQFFAQQDIEYQGGEISAPEPQDFTNFQFEDSDDLILLNTGQNLGVADEDGFVQDPVTGLNILPEDIPVEELDGYVTEFTPEGPRMLSSAEVEEAAARQAALNQARQQQTIAQQRRQINNGDWRVRLRLAPQAKYLYKSNQPGILQPLAVTDGIIFPYTPQIDTVYRANYSNYDLTHSNYRGYFYQNSYIDTINLRATFTAQGTPEANYLLAVIHFLRSVTKMFYGQDVERGSPPPLVYLTGLGEYQFNEHPCLVSSFSYNLPDNVDYIRAGSTLQSGLNLSNQRDRQTVSTNSIFGSIERLANALLPPGAQPTPFAPPTLGTNRPTYVPTKIEINLTLLPVQSREQVSKQFSLKAFANGNLLRGGFW